MIAMQSHPRIGPAEHKYNPISHQAAGALHPDGLITVPYLVEMLSDADDVEPVSKHQA
jgi:hypothetical protein